MWLFFQQYPEYVDDKISYFADLEQICIILSPGVSKKVRRCLLKDLQFYFTDNQMNLKGYCPFECFEKLVDGAITYFILARKWKA